MPTTSKPAPTIASLYSAYLEADAAARKQWDKKDVLIKKLVKLAKVGRKTQVVVRLSESRGLRLTDNSREFRKEGKLFAPAFARRWELKEVPMSEDEGK